MHDIDIRSVGFQLLIYLIPYSEHRIEHCA